MNSKNFFYKLTHWEYWPSYMFYIPNLPLALYLALKARNPVFFSAVNPGIHHSGNGMESKYDTIKLIPKKLRPKTILIQPEDPFKSVIHQLKKHQIEFPLIIKPDIGFRGLLVKKIKSLEELQAYINRYPIKLLIQEFIDLPNECGIFYYRLPDEQKGKITSITFKEFSSVKGDGTLTIKELILSDTRAKLYIDLLEEIHTNKLDIVLKKDENFELNAIGNHCKGTRFVDGNKNISTELEQSFDKLNKQIDAWYYGRIDIKYNHFDDLIKGDNFKILEINGIISEPTHIYDATTQTYFKALKSIANHWKIIYKIARINHEVLHFPYAKTKAFLKDTRKMNRYTKKLKRLNSQ